MKGLFDEKTVEELAGKILDGLSTKIKTDIGNSFYDHYEQYLYEHYENAKDKIEKNLIENIADQFIENPKDYKYESLRRKIWDENKKELTNVLTYEAIQDSVENVILRYTYRDYHFSWKWKDGIAEFVLKNWDKFKDDQRIKDAFGRELDRKNNYIECLKEKLLELGEDEA